MKLLFAASEGLPFVKVGGLGDVIGSLPKALAEKGHDVRVVLPFYSTIGEREKSLCHYLTSFYFSLSWRNCYCGVFTAQQEGVTYYLLDNQQYFFRRAPYGEYDDAERFAFFSKGVLELLPVIDFYPDILHLNDWHTALAAVYLQTQYRFYPNFGRIKTVLSIHNIEFQGKYGWEIMEDVLGIDSRYRSLLEYDGCVNLLKGGIEAADLVTTVSKSYAEELLNPRVSFGLHHILRLRRQKLSGIVNGIDTGLFDPATDSAIAVNYSAENFAKKAENKRSLQQELGLPTEENLPLIGMVSRLTAQKGFDLLTQVWEELMALPMQIVVLGTGYPEYEAFWRSMSLRYPHKVKAVIAYSAPLAQRIYAGADLFLMPSFSEPCGLSQMIAMRYGTIPVVHYTGGLKDTVFAYSPESGEGNGVTFQSYQAGDMLNAIHRSIALWQDPYHRQRLIQNGMSGDYSWNRSAEQYLAIYHTLLND